MKPDDPLAEKEYITAKDLHTLPIILTKRTVVQNELASWFGDYFEKLHIFATHDLSGNAAILVENGLGYALVVEGSVSLYSKEKVCFKPFYPELTATSVLAWKKYQIFSRAVTKFLKSLR